jgi:hypothetical protein
MTPTKIVTFSADADSEAGTAEVASVTNSATTWLQSLETVLTAEVVGQLETEGTALAQRLREDVGGNAQVGRGMTNLRELSRVSPEFTVRWCACCVNLWRIYCDWHLDTCASLRENSVWRHVSLIDEKFSINIFDSFSRHSDWRHVRHSPYICKTRASFSIYF